jgi:hypothetical protein
MSSQEIGKNDCPICFEPVVQNRWNCLQCITCKQKIHGKCEIEWNHKQKPINRLLSDDILMCPVCKGDLIANCSDLTTDINADIKKAVDENPHIKGGKTKKTKKTRKTRKQRNKTINKRLKSKKV